MVDERRRSLAHLLRWGEPGNVERERVLWHVQRLPARQRRAVELTAVQGLTEEGAAYRLGISRRTICADLTEAWGNLVKSLDGA